MVVNHLMAGPKVTCPCFQHSLNNFQLLWLRWSLSHSSRLLLNQEWGMSGYWLVDSSGITAGRVADFLLCGLTSSTPTQAGLLFLQGVMWSCFVDSLVVMLWRLAGILFSTTEAIMSSRMFGIVRPSFPVCGQQQNVSRNINKTDSFWI